MMLRPALLAALAVAIVAPAFAETQVWECKVERRIERSVSVMYTASDRARPEMRLDFVVDVPDNKGCLLRAGAKDRCDVLYTGAAEEGGIVRLDMKSPDNMLDLVNIFPKTGSFIRIHGDMQWMGKAGDCNVAKGRNVELP